MMAVEARGAAEHHVAAAGDAPIRVGEIGTDDQVVDAVAVDVTRGGDNTAAAVV